MDSYQYAQGFVKGLSPFSYRGKSPNFYKSRLRETQKSQDFSYSVDPAYQYLVPSKWHKTGWKYSSIPAMDPPLSEKPTSDFLTTYSSFYKPYSNAKTVKAQKPKDSIFQPCGNLKMPRLRRILQ